MALQVILINGSPRKRTTAHYLGQIAAMLEAEGVSTTTISLADYQIADCTGCEQCIRKTTWCVLPDASREILSLVLDADGLVLASPVYVGTVTGKLKSLLDKTASWLHRPPAVGLPVLPVVTTAGSGLKRTLAYLSEAVIYWGAHPVSGIRRSATNDGPVQPGELEEFLRCLRTPRERYRPSLRQVMLFQVQKVLAVKVAEIDRRFWREKGWDTTDYYFDCRIGLVKRLLGRLLFAVLMHRIKPTHPY